MKKLNIESPRFPEYYKNNNPEWSAIQCEQAATKFRRESNWQCIEYWVKRHPELSEEECRQKMIQKKNEKNSNSKYSIEYWVKRHPELSEEECQTLRHEYTSSKNYQSIEYWRALHPNKSDQELEIIKNKSIKNAIGKRPDNTGINNPNHASNTSDLQRKQRSPLCIEFYEKKYPNLSKEEQEKLWHKHCSNIKHITSNKKIQPMCIEYWIAKGYNEQEASLKVREVALSKVFTLEKCIKKYGVEKGTNVFEERQIKWQESLHKIFNHEEGLAQSLIAKDFFSNLILKGGIEEYKYEYQLGRYSFDFKYKNILIEFNGDYWHCNPLIYEASFFNKTNKKYAREIWLKDNKKYQLAKSKGYNIYIVWENEYSSDKTQTIQKCIDFINENS